MVFKGFNKTTLLDFPGRVASTVFTGGCNFKCPFCQNSDLVLDASSIPDITEEEVIAHLEKRQGVVEGICITGGEPTLQPDLIPFIRRLKKTGTAVKLDTNGYRPDVLEELLTEGLIDMAAMDIKSDPETYAKVAGIKDLDIRLIMRSAELLMNSDTDYEFRTTVVKEFFNRKTAERIADWLKGAGKYFLQRFEDSERVMDPGLSSPSVEEMREYRQILSGTIRQVELRGVDY